MPTSRWAAGKGARPCRGIAGHALHMPMRAKVRGARGFHARQATTRHFCHAMARLARQPPSGPMTLLSVG